MRTKNEPVPAHTRAPAGHRWLWWIGPPAVLALAYRLIPPRVRRLWNPRGGSTSHLGLAAILAGGGWRAFFAYALPFAGLDAVPHRRTPWTLGIADPNMWWLPQPGGK